MDPADLDNVTLPVGSATASTPCACSSQIPLAPSAPTCADAEVYSFFSHDLLQYVPVQRQVRHQPFEFAVLLAQLPQLAQLAQCQPRVLLLPDVKRGLADPVLAADVGDLLSTLRLMQLSLPVRSVSQHFPILQATSLNPPAAARYGWPLISTAQMTVRSCWQATATVARL